MVDLKRLLDNAKLDDPQSLKVLGIELVRRGYVGNRASQKDKLAEDLSLEYTDIFRDNAKRHLGRTTSMLLDALIELRGGSRVMLVANHMDYAEDLKINLERMALRLGIEYKKRIFCSSYDRVMDDTRGRANMVCLFDPFYLG